MQWYFWMQSATMCAAVDETAALDALEVFAEHRDKKYPKIASFWRDNWPNLSTYFKYPQEIRRLIYTTNLIEGFNRKLRKVTKAKSVFPTYDSLFKMLYLAMMDITNILPLFTSLRDYTDFGSVPKFHFASNCLGVKKTSSYGHVLHDRSQLPWHLAAPWHKK